MAADTPQPWWDAAACAASGSAELEIEGVRVVAGSVVRLRPSRRVDVQDLFFAGRVATVIGVRHDVEGRAHVAVVLRDDPSGELHEWYGRYLYFGPDELEPVVAGAQP